MANALVIHTARDSDFVRNHLLRALPSRGFDLWSGAWQRFLDRGHVALVVVSKAAADVGDVSDGARAARKQGIPLIPVVTDQTPVEAVSSALEGLVTADFRTPFEDAYWRLAKLLPPMDPEEPSTSTNEGFTPIDWDEDVFSSALGATVRQHNHHAAVELISAFERHCATRSVPYGVDAAKRDLKSLRQYRKFRLMVDLGASALRTGTKGTGTVRKLYAQALIEQRDYDYAFELLNDILNDQAADAFEISEARGLIGRIHKQRYVNRPNAPDAASQIQGAIQAYGDVYAKDPGKFWHGINAATCILRATRDGIPNTDPKHAKTIARTILADIQKKEVTEALPLWDRATRVEAHLALEQYGEAAEALHDYLEAFSSDDDTAPYPFFEIAATQRQFDEVLELDKVPEARSVLRELNTVAERYRSGTVLRSSTGSVSSAGGFEAVEHVRDAVKRLPLLIRVADPHWEPRDDLLDLEISARMGTIISARGTDATRKALLRDLGVISVEESYPAGSEECDMSMPFIRATAVWQDFGERGAGALIGVIDNGIDVLHEAFFDDSGRSRIVEIWDQMDEQGPPPPGFTHGTHHTAEDIARYRAENKVPTGLGRNRRGNGHGTHVASIAAGRRVGGFAGGVAPEAKLVIVRSAAHEPLGYSSSHLEALNYIDKVATRLDMPVVVNVSQGMNAGAHDGTSALEVAFNEFSSGGRKPGRVVVKSAGNERHKSGHAKVSVPAQSMDRITWRRPHNGTARERIELWWSSADDMKFRLKNPTGDWTDWVREGPSVEGTFPSGDKYRLEHVRRHRDNGDSNLLVQLESSNGSKPQSGEWRLEIGAGKTPMGGEIHAWIERGLGTPSAFTAHADEEMTLSIPGTADEVIAVGAVEHAEFIAVGAFSSYGPTRDGRRKPEVAAPGINIRAAAAGTVNESRIDTGTSMAAPHVTGALALLLSKNPDLVSSQISSALWQTTRNFNGTWNPGQGYGVLDVVGLMSAL